MPDPIALSSDAELRALAERALDANYELDCEIGRGGMGIVYRAKDRRLKRIVAIKVLPPELAYRSEIRSRFLREAETAAQLSHPNIVPIYSVDEREGLVFFAMAYVDGPTLAKRLHDEGRIPVDVTRRILREVADALAYAHSRGVIHRDIKPDNILLDRESGRAMVTDFGIARAVQEGGDSRLTATGVAIGTPAYMSPEQAAGDREIDGRSDLYSLGIVAYQMLAGQLPFQAASTPSMLMKHISELPRPVAQLRPDAPPELDAIVMTLLEKEPEHRFPSASALALALSGDTSVIPQRTNAIASASAADADRPWAPVPANHTSPIPQGAHTGVPGAGQYTTPTPDDIARWSAPPVARFRSSFATYAAVNAVIVIVSLFTDHDYMTITLFWSMFMAFKYSKLWTAGYDWRDVFRQPRERQLLDVASETVEDVRRVFSPERRRVPRRSAPRPALPPGALPSPGAGAPAPAGDFGAHAADVQRAAEDRAEILRIVTALPRSDQALVDGVIPAAEALYQRVHSLALALPGLERTSSADAMRQLESEIESLEAQANPLDVSASEERVRRLALLKLQRRGLADDVRRRDEARGKLESCLLALHNMRLDVLRLRAGGIASASEHITMLTERARALADEVDAAVQGVDDARRAAGARGASRGRT